MSLIAIAKKENRKRVSKAQRNLTVSEVQTRYCF